jgi:microcystin degradation protein MlrC
MLTTAATAQPRDPAQTPQGHHRQRHTALRAAYDAVAAEVIAIDSPGVTQAGPETFQYKARPRPLFPLEQVEHWTPATL